MTILNAILEELNPYPIRASLIEKKCIDAGLVASAEYTLYERPAIVGILIEVLTQYLVLANISEGGVSMSFKADDIKARLIALKKEIGEDSEGLEPTVKMLFL